MNYRAIPMATLVAACVATVGCGRASPPSASVQPKAAAALLPVPTADATGYARLERDVFNRLAAERFLPWFWQEDRNKDKTLQPNEWVRLTTVTGTDRNPWLQDGAFTPEFSKIYEELVAIHQHGWNFQGLSGSEQQRRQAVLAELAQGRPTLLLTDLQTISPQEKRFVAHILKAAARIEKLYGRQNAVDAVVTRVVADDWPSMALIARNQGPWCVGPKTEQDKNCNALPNKPAKLSGLYPANLQLKPGFCQELAALPNHDALLDPFTVVWRDAKGDLVALPYREEYGLDMDATAQSLESAAAEVVDPAEAPLHAYVLAAAGAFRTGRWLEADEAWAKMNASNSKWYLRVGADEVYNEPCATKAGFHLVLARIDQGSLKWQNILDPLKKDMEATLAEMSGPPYVARNVSFHLPDFIQIVINAGDSRSPLGATVGQSLPNWGPVANEGRGRTVAMTNVGTDPDSQAALELQADSLFCPQTRRDFTTDPGPIQMSTVLHEAAHNLGPAHEYQVDGKADVAIFGGSLAATLEELKAQTAALYLTDWLQARKTIDEKTARQAHLADIAWNFGHIAAGMHEADGKPKPYSHLAAIQVGALQKSGAIVWHADQKAANGQDLGCFEVVADKTAPAIAQLMREVGGIKARGDKTAALALVQTYTSDTGEFAQLREKIRDRWLRAPKATYVYAVRL